MEPNKVQWPAAAHDSTFYDGAEPSVNERFINDFRLEQDVGRTALVIDLRRGSHPRRPCAVGHLGRRRDNEVKRAEFLRLASVVPQVPYQPIRDAQADDPRSVEVGRRAQQIAAADGPCVERSLHVPRRHRPAYRRGDLEVGDLPAKQRKLLTLVLQTQLEELLFGGELTAFGEGVAAVGDAERRRLQVGEFLLNHADLADRLFNAQRQLGGGERHERCAGLDEFAVADVDRIDNPVARREDVLGEARRENARGVDGEIAFDQHKSRDRRGDCGSDDHPAEHPTEPEPPAAVRQTKDTVEERGGPKAFAP